MQTRLTLTSNELTDLVVQVRASFTYENLLRGFDAYKQHAVNYFQITEKSLILARVKMPEFYDIQLDLDFLSISTCTCSDGGFCEHMAAVFFAVYQQHRQSPDRFIHECATVIKELETAQDMQAAKARKAQEKQTLEKLLQEQKLQAPLTRSAGSNRPVKEASQVRKNTVQVPSLETDNVEAWHQYFQSMYEQEEVPHGQGRDEDELIRILCKPMALWETTLRQLFETHVRLFVLLKLEESYQKIDESESFLYYMYESHLRHSFYECFEELEELIANIKFKKMTDDYRKIIEATERFLEQKFYHKSFELIDTFALYTIFWTDLLGVEPFRKHEMDRLDLALQKPREQNRDFIIHARAFHDWLEGQDEAATERLQDVEKLYVPHILQQLGHLYEKDEWSRLYHWLRWLFPYIQSQDHEEIEEYFFFWSETNKVRPLEDEFLQTMATLLPYSNKEYYAEYLLENGHYKRWVDLQMMTDELPIYLDTYDLKKVESANPAYLLPLYHQAIEQCILEKNRDAYESAVTMLKKLKQLYKQLNQLNKWEAYIAYTVKKYSRLRSFQEELKRGKVVS